MVASLKDISIIPKKVIEVPGGNVLRGIKSSEDNFHGFEELYFSFAKKNYVKAWKKHLKAVKTDNQIELYQMLCLLEAETNPTLFQERIQQFSTYCSSRKPAFQKYFMQYYATRPGKVCYYCSTLCRSCAWLWF